MEEVPMWFVILFTVVIVLMLLRAMFLSVPFSGLINVFKGKKTVLGCLFESIAMLFLGVLLIWYIIDELFF